MQDATARDEAEVLVGRRQFSRVGFRLGAHLVGDGFDLPVQIEDLSAQGVRVSLMKPRKVPSGKLTWLGYSAFVTPIWQQGLDCGLMFVEPLDAECLTETRRLRADKGR